MMSVTFDEIVFRCNIKDKTRLNNKIQQLIIKLRKDNTSNLKERKFEVDIEIVNLHPAVVHIDFL